MGKCNISEGRFWFNWYPNESESKCVVKSVNISSPNFAQGKNPHAARWPFLCKITEKGEKLVYNLELFRHPPDRANCVKGGSATQVVGV
jgi:hypothetical protein